jgi:hypothetical protein
MPRVFDVVLGLIRNRKKNKIRDELRGLRIDVDAPLFSLSGATFYCFFYCYCCFFYFYFYYCFYFFCFFCFFCFLCCFLCCCFIENPRVLSSSSCC